MLWHDPRWTGAKTDSIKFRAVLLGAYGSFRVSSVKLVTTSEVPNGPDPAGRLMVATEATPNVRRNAPGRCMLIVVLVLLCLKNRIQRANGFNIYTSLLDGATQHREPVA